LYCFSFLLVHFQSSSCFRSHQEFLIHSLIPAGIVSHIVALSGQGSLSRTQHNVYGWRCLRIALFTDCLRIAIHTNVNCRSNVECYTVFVYGSISEILSLSNESQRIRLYTHTIWSSFSWTGPFLKYRFWTRKIHISLLGKFNLCSV